MIKVDECEPIGELEAKFPYRDVQIKRGVDVKAYYDLEAEIGRGKFGTVYLCREKATNLSLAAKFVGIQRRQDRKNVEREVEIMRTLQHPRLIQLYDAFETDNTMVVVLELIEGGELFERVIGDDFILTEKACTIFMRQICEGVAFIHKNNIIHLDLKPENILCLTKTGNRIKIIDFGLARHYEPGSKLQVLFGTPEFVAPEVVNFDQISPATDMWSVGVICYVLLSGLSPFMGDTDVETMTNVTLSRYDFDDESFDNISENAKDFITNLLLNKKEARLTADQCLEHPWLRRKIPPPPPELITSKENLKSFVDSYHNINVIAENNAHDMINRKPSTLSAVELIAASDKEFLNRDDAKSFKSRRRKLSQPKARKQISQPSGVRDTETARDIGDDVTGFTSSANSP
uniref:Myosin light chain kinase, smooth muscle n=1 Tax=Lygus hesperus TaxID=30085 RepID=A0A0A9VX40_LYGHE